MNGNDIQLNVEHWTSNIEYWESIETQWTLNAEHRTFNRCRSASKANGNERETQSYNIALWEWIVYCIAWNWFKCDCIRIQMIFSSNVSIVLPKNQIQAPRTHINEILFYSRLYINTIYILFNRHFLINRFWVLKQQYQTC